MNRESTTVKDRDHAISVQVLNNNSNLSRTLCYLMLTQYHNNQLYDTHIRYIASSPAHSQLFNVVCRNIENDRKWTGDKATHKVKITILA